MLRQWPIWLPWWCLSCTFLLGGWWILVSRWSHRWGPGFLHVCHRMLTPVLFMVWGVAWGRGSSFHVDVEEWCSFVFGVCWCHLRYSSGGACGLSGIGGVKTYRVKGSGKEVCRRKGTKTMNKKGGWYDLYYVISLQCVPPGNI